MLVISLLFLAYRRP